MKIIYGLAEKVSQVYGHGDHGEEYMIKAENGYYGRLDYPPFFEKEEDAKSHLSSMDSYKRNRFKVVEILLK